MRAYIIVRLGGLRRAFCLGEKHTISRPRPGIEGQKRGTDILKKKEREKKDMAHTNKSSIGAVRGGGRKQKCSGKKRNKIQLLERGGPQGKRKRKTKKVCRILNQYRC